MANIFPKFQNVFILEYLLVLTCFSAAERVKSLSKKDTAPRGKKDEIKDFDQWRETEEIHKKDLSSEENTTGWWSGAPLGEEECIFDN